MHKIYKSYFIESSYLSSLFLNYLLPIFNIKENVKIGDANEKVKNRNLYFNIFPGTDY